MARLTAFPVMARPALPCAFWKLCTVLGVVLTAHFSRCLLGMRSKEQQAARAPTTTHIVDAASPLIERTQSEPEIRPNQLLARLAAAERDREICNLLEEVEPSADESVTYAITDVLARTTFASVRECVANALAAQPTAPAHSWLIDLAEDPQPPVHRAALESLAEREDTLAQVVVSDAAHSADPSIRVSAAIALVKAQKDAAFPLAKELLHTLDHAETISELIDALGQSHDARALPLLSHAIGNGERAVHLRAIAAVGELGLEAGVGVLEPFLAEGSDDEFSEAASSLAKLLGDAVLPRLTTALQSENINRRLSALSALGDLKTPAAKAVLLSELKSSEVSHAGHALRQLARSADPASVSVLLEAAKRDDELFKVAERVLETKMYTKDQIRERRIRALKGTEDASERLQALLHLLHDSDEQAQAAVEEYVQRSELQAYEIGRIVASASPQTVKSLIERFRGAANDEASMQLQASLARRADPSFITELRRMSEADDDLLGELAATTLLKLGDEETAKRRSTRLMSSESNERREAVQLLRWSMDDAALMELEKLALDDSSSVSSAALGVLAERDPSRAASLAKRAFDIGSEYQRYYALSAVSGMNSLLIESLFRAALGDSDEDVAQAGVEYFKNLEGVEAMRELISVAGDARLSEPTRRAAAEALSGFGGPLIRANQALIRSLLSEEAEENPHCAHEVW